MIKSLANLGIPWEVQVRIRLEKSDEYVHFSLYIIRFGFNIVWSHFVPISEKAKNFKYYRGSIQMYLFSVSGFHEFLQSSDFHIIVLYRGKKMQKLSEQA